MKSILRHKDEILTALEKLKYPCDEIIEHYGKCEIEPLNGEIVLDSIQSVDDFVGRIMEEII